MVYPHYGSSRYPSEYFGAFFDLPLPLDRGCRLIRASVRGLPLEVICSSVEEIPREIRSREEGDVHT